MAQKNLLRVVQKVQKVEQNLLNLNKTGQNNTLKSKIEKSKLDNNSKKYVKIKL